MITCNKCGYDKAVQGLNEIWCDKCDAKPSAAILGHVHAGGTPWPPPGSEAAKYYSNALPSEPFEDAMGDCGIQAFPRADVLEYARDDKTLEHIRLHADMMRNDAAHVLARKESIFDRADRYFDKQDICTHVNAFFHEELHEYWLNLAHGGDVSRDRWSAVIASNGNPMCSYAHKSLESLCDVLEMALYTHDEAMEKSLMDVVRTAVEDYFNDEE